MKVKDIKDRLYLFNNGGCDEYELCGIFGSKEELIKYAEDIELNASHLLIIRGIEIEIKPSLYFTKPK